MRPLALLGFSLCLLAVAPSSHEPTVPPPPPDCGCPPVEPSLTAPAVDLACLAPVDPIAFLQECLARYDRDVHGYTMTLQKQERLGGKLHPVEIVAVHFRDKPHSVLLHWRQGARLVERALYVEGENGGQTLALPAGRILRMAGVVARDVGGEDARQSGRFTLKQFGIKKGMERALEAWQKAHAEGGLFVEVVGEESPEAAGGRPCLVLKRSRYLHPEDDGITELTLWFDRETWLQVGSCARGEGGRLIGEYWMRDLCLNPSWEAGQFTRAALKK